MKLKGDWDSGTSYSVGDVVRYTDGVIYHLQKPCAAGITPLDTLYWGKADSMTAQAALFALDAVGIAGSNTETEEAKVSALIAPEYSKKTYNAGDLVTHNKKLYKAKADINPADNAWTAAHWDETTVGAVIPKNISSDAISLMDGTDEYIITVDATGEEPALDVQIVTEEAGT